MTKRSVESGAVPLSLSSLIWASLLVSAASGGSRSWLMRTAEVCNADVHVYVNFELIESVRFDSVFTTGNIVLYARILVLQEPFYNLA